MIGGTEISGTQAASRIRARTGEQGADIGILFTVEIFQKYKQALSGRPVEHRSEHIAFCRGQMSRP